MIRVAFLYGDSSLVERVICEATHSPFAHVETEINGRWWSARMGRGIGFIDALDPARKWEIVEAPYTLSKEAVAWATLLCGRHYDYPALLHFVLGWSLDLAGTEICSKASRDLLARCPFDGDGPGPAVGEPDIPCPGEHYAALTGKACAQQSDAEMAALVSLLRQRPKTVGFGGGGGLIDMSHINATADAITAKVNAADLTDLAAIAALFAKLVNAVDSDKILKQWRAEVAAGTIPDFLKG